MNLDVAETRLIDVIHAAFSGEANMTSVPALAALDLALTKLGLYPAVRAYLVANFGVESLVDVKFDDLNRAVQFVVELQTRVPAQSPVPIPPGTRIEGDFLWIRGTVIWAGERLEETA